MCVCVCVCVWVGVRAMGSAFSLFCCVMIRDFKIQELAVLLNVKWTEDCRIAVLKTAPPLCALSIDVKHMMQS